MIKIRFSILLSLVSLKCRLHDEIMLIEKEGKNHLKQKQLSIGVLQASCSPNSALNDLKMNREEVHFLLELMYFPPVIFRRSKLSKQ